MSCIKGIVSIYADLAGNPEENAESSQLTNPEGHKKTAGDAWPPADLLSEL